MKMIKLCFNPTHISLLEKKKTIYPSRHPPHTLSVNVTVTTKMFIGDILIRSTQISVPCNSMGLDPRKVAMELHPILEVGEFPYFSLDSGSNN